MGFNTVNKVKPEDPKQLPAEEKKVNFPKESGLSVEHKYDSASSTTSFGSQGTRKHFQLEGHDDSSKDKISELRRFWRKFYAVVFSPIFLRHRNVFYVLVELFAPALVSFVLFAAFTSGISWKQIHYDRVDTARGNVLHFPELSMETAMSHFRSTHADKAGHTLIYFTPVNPFTTGIMSHTLEQLGLQDSNRIDQGGHSSTGVVGIPNEMEMIERAMYHRREENYHKTPVTVAFKYDENDVDPVTKLPYNVSFSISTFDDEISRTADNYPYMEPPKSKHYVSPYVSSGFIGLQYAIEFSIIRTILEKQKEIVAEISRKNDSQPSARFGRAEDMGFDNLPELSEQDMFGFLAEVPGSTVDRHDGEDDKKHHRRSRLMHIDTIGVMSDLPEVRLKMFGYTNYTNDGFRLLLTFAVAFSLVVAYIFLSFFIVKQIVEENLCGIKDLLQMHGLPNYIHWIILLFHAIVLRGVTAALITVAIRMDYGYGSIVTWCNPAIVFLFLWIHLLALTFMNFFIATFLRSVKMCTAIAVSSGVLSFYLPDTFYGMQLVGIYTDYALVMVFPNWCLRHIIRCLIDYESDEKGIDWYNIMEVDHVENKLSVGGGVLLLCVTGLAYYFLAIYHDLTSTARLFPPNNRWYDFTERARQRKESRMHHKELLKDISEGREGEFEKPVIYEEPNKHMMQCFVHIRNVSKRYGKHKVALNSINMNIIHEEITVVLGHSGAGKTTLISILAGMTIPSNGYATVKGYDVHFDSRRARKYTGLCPQKLVAFNLLTVREHVNLCYRLRGYTRKESNLQSANILTKLKLWNVRSFLPNNLTRDELRRLGIALAIADAPEVLLLDEPTGGMDPGGRREVWDIILSLRPHHTIILTTNYMDEAEFLGDRIALLAHGRLVCYGSLDFLRKQYDTGYFLKILPFPNVVRLDNNAVLNIVHNHIPNGVNIKKHTRIKDVNTLVLELPTKEKPRFADLCEDLEQKKEDLKILKYSIRQVSLSDIFIKICSSVAATGYAMDLYVRRDSTGEIRSALTSEIPAPPEKAQLTMDHRHHLTALLQKRWAVIKSRTKTILAYLVIPLIVIWMTVFQAKSFVLPEQGINQNPKRILDTKSYEDLKLFYRVGRDDPAVNYSKHIDDILNPYGIPLQGSDRVITKLYEALNAKPGRIGYAKEQHFGAFELRRVRTPSHDTNDFVGYFASGALHSAPIVLNTIANLYLRAISGTATQEGRHYSATAINDPMPKVGNAKYEDGCGVTCILLAVLMSFAMAFISHSCILFPMMERENGMKHMQLMCGVHPVIYWIADFVVDSVVMSIMVIIVVITFLGDYYHTFNTAEIVAALWVICTFYLMWSGLLYAYFMSSIIPAKWSGYNILGVLHLWFGIVPMIWFARTESGEGVLFRNCLMAFVPPFTISSAFYHYFNMAAIRNICRNTNDYIQKICDVGHNSHPHLPDTGHFQTEKEQFDALAQEDPQLARCCPRMCLPTRSCFRAPDVFNSTRESWNSPHLITATVSLVFQGFFYFGLLILAERKVLSILTQRVIMKFLEYREKNSKVPRTSRDVRHESLAVRASLEEEEFPEDLAMIIKDLTKSYTSTMIIKDFCLELKKGQCVAILGGGGCGKSTLARMIAGQMMPTRGDCYVKGASLLRNRKDYLSCIGYCPQKNCLFPDFTAAQMLELMGRLRGVPANLLNTNIQKWLSVFGLAEVSNDKCIHYGPGMRQRLSAAMALIGSPQIILMDEPTSGIDPAARERFWAVIEHLSTEGQTIIFTTYTSDEAFTLASKVIIISEGGTQCIGDPEALQKKYGRGHTITFKLKHDLLSPIEVASVTMGRVTDFKKVVDETFKHIDLLDEHDDILLYFLRDSRFTLADVFRRAEYLATMYDVIVQNYEVNEAEIDDVFIYLANKFHELDKPHRSEPQHIINISKEEAEVQALKQANVILGMDKLSK